MPSPECCAVRQRNGYFTGRTADNQKRGPGEGNTAVPAGTRTIRQIEKVLGTAPGAGNDPVLDPGEEILPFSFGHASAGIPQALGECPDECGLEIRRALLPAFPCDRIVRIRREAVLGIFGIEDEDR